MLIEAGGEYCRVNRTRERKTWGKWEGLIFPGCARQERRKLETDGDEIVSFPSESSFNISFNIFARQSGAKKIRTKNNKQYDRSYFSSPFSSFFESVEYQFTKEKRKKRKKKKSWHYNCHPITFPIVRNERQSPSRSPSRLIPRLFQSPCRVPIVK